MTTQSPRTTPAADREALGLAIDCRDVRYAFGDGATRVEVLHGVDLAVARGEVVVLMGPSGSGKTTLLTLLGCLRGLQGGGVRLLGQELSGADPPLLMRMRQRVGFIFQLHNLHASLTAAQNVRMALEVHGRQAANGDWRAAADHALGLVGLSDRIDFLPEKLSGGQKQRVAVARAIVGNPDVVFADEPTAALDRESGRNVVELLRRMADERGAAVIMVTHDHRVTDLADRIVSMEDGRVVAGQA